MPLWLTYLCHSLCRFLIVIAIERYLISKYVHTSRVSEWVLQWHMKFLVRVSNFRLRLSFVNFNLNFTLALFATCKIWVKISRNSNSTVNYLLLLKSSCVMLYFAKVLNPIRLNLLVLVMRNEHIELALT